MIITEGSRRGRDSMVVGFTTTCTSMHVTTDVESSNPGQDDVYNII